MIRLVLFLVLFSVAVAAIAYGVYLAWRSAFGLSPAERRAADKTDAESARLLASAVRLLETGLTDPMYRQSIDWTESARNIVDAYYEGD